IFLFVLVIITPQPDSVFGSLIPYLSLHYFKEHIAFLKLFQLTFESRVKLLKSGCIVVQCRRINELRKKARITVMHFFRRIFEVVSQVKNPVAHLYAAMII